MTDDDHTGEDARTDPSRTEQAPPDREVPPGERTDGDQAERTDGGVTEEGAVVSETGRPSLKRIAERAAAVDLRPLDVVVYAIYGLAMVFFAFPVLWVVSASLRPEGELFSYPFRLIPREVSLSAYEQVFEAGMLTWLFNSTLVSVLGVAGILAVSVPAAYAFSRFEFRGRRGLLGLVLLFQMISPVIIIVPLYSVMTSLGLIRTRIGLILLYIGIQTPFSIWLLKGYFDTIPRELDYAARIDGCNRLQTLRHVLLRPIAPGLAVVAIFNTVLTWSEFVLAYTVISTESELYTISIGVYNFQNQFGNDWRAIAAASVVGMLPLVVVFIALQRYFVKGLVEGSLKGQ